MAYGGSEALSAVFFLPLRDHYVKPMTEMRSREPRGAPIPRPSVIELEDADGELAEELDEGAATTVLGQSTLNCVILVSFPIH